MVSPLLQGPRNLLFLSWGSTWRDPTGPRCQSTWAVPSLELELPVCCDEFGLWPRKRNGFEKRGKGSRCETWHRRTPDADWGMTGFETKRRRLWADAAQMGESKKSCLGRKGCDQSNTQAGWISVGRSGVHQEQRKGACSTRVGLYGRVGEGRLQEGYVWGNLPVLGRPRGWSGSFLASLLKSSSFLGFISPLKGIPSLGHELPICSLKICSKIAQSLKFTFGLQVYAFAGGYCSALVLHGFLIFLLLGVQSAPQLSCPAFSLYTTQMTTIWQQIWDIFFYLFSSLSFLDFNMYFILFFFAAKCRK